METIRDLIGLLVHHLNNLYSTEQQQVKFIPRLIEKAQHNSLKNALKHHLELTKEQLGRLQKIPELVNGKIDAARKNAVSAIDIATVSIDKEAVCKGMQGLIDEANDLLAQPLNEYVTDAAIIAAVQKIEHYEICTYGTAAAYASQLKIKSAENLLNESLQEEYDADDLLTALATAALNKEATPDAIKFLETVAIDDEENGSMTNDHTVESDAGKVIISERNVASPGGRAGTSHRRYPSGESRGH
jgi:ferritin-like metal-binding protein YciE